MSKINSAIELMRKFTKTEKRYITLQVNRTSSGGLNPNKQSSKTLPSHLRLFNLLAKFLKEQAPKREESSHVTDSLKDQLRQLKSGSPDLFSAVNISRLMDFMLNSLRQYNADKPPFNKWNYIQNIEILQEKKLYKQADEWILKGLADFNKEETDGGDLLKLKFQILQRKNAMRSERVSKDQMNTFNLQTNNQLNRIKWNLETLGDQEKAIHEGIRKKGDLSDFSIEDFSPLTQAFIREPTTTARRPDIPAESLLRGLNIASLYLRRDIIRYPEDAQKSIECNVEMLAYFDRNPTLKETSTAKYYNTLLVLSNTSLVLGIDLYLERYIDQLEAVLGFSGLRELSDRQLLQQEIQSIDFGDHTSELQYNCLQVILLYYYGKGFSTQGSAQAPNPHIEIAHQLALHTKVEIEKQSRRSSGQASLYYTLASIFLMVDQLEEAQEINNRILHYQTFHPNQKVPTKVEFQSRLLDTLILFEKAS